MDTSKERYEFLQERIGELEVKRAEYESEGLKPPGWLRVDLAEFQIEAEEIRRAGHRAMVREAAESRKATQRRDLQERLRADFLRIANAPPVEPSEIRERREALGATQQLLAQFSGVSKGTINRTECGASTPEPLTLRLIAAGLELLENSRKEAV